MHEQFDMKPPKSRLSGGLGQWLLIRRRSRRATTSPYPTRQGIGSGGAALLAPRPPPLPRLNPTPRRGGPRLARTRLPVESSATIARGRSASPSERRVPGDVPVARRAARDVGACRDELLDDALVPCLHARCSAVWPSALPPAAPRASASATPVVAVERRCAAASTRSSPRPSRAARAPASPRRRARVAAASLPRKHAT